MTNFEKIKNMDIDTLAMLLAMDRKKTINEVFELLGVDCRVTKDFVAKHFENIRNYLEGDANV